MTKRKMAIASMALTAMCVTTLALVGCSTHTHTLESIAKEDATCTAAGHEAYYKCNDPECGKLFSDSEGKTEISAIPTIAAKGHDMTKHDSVPATCTTDGTAEYYTCKNEAETVYYANAQGTEKITDLTVKATGHKMTKHDAVAPDCDHAGNKVYYTCEYEPDILYANEQGTETTTLEQITVAQKQHSIVPVEGVPATCVEAGKQAHYECLNCHKLYSDEEGNELIEDEESLTIPKSQTHTGDPIFAYDVAPDAVADGGELDATCSLCKATMKVKYDSGKVASTSKTAPNELAVAGSSYFKKKDKNTNCWIGFIISQPGTYTVAFDSVYLVDGVENMLRDFYINAGEYGAAAANGGIITSGRWQLEGALTPLAKKVRGTLLIDGKAVDTESDYVSPSSSSFTVSFSVDSDDLKNENLYIAMNYYWNKAKNTTPACGVMVKLSLKSGVQKTCIAAEQYALLPAKRLG